MIDHRSYGLKALIDTGVYGSPAIQKAGAARVLIKGINTAGITSRTAVNLVGDFEVTGTEQVTTSEYGTETVFILQRI